MYWQQLCNQRKMFSHNVETNNKGILHLQDVRGAWRSISGPRLWIPELTGESQVGVGVRVVYLFVFNYTRCKPFQFVFRAMHCMQSSSAFFPTFM